MQTYWISLGSTGLAGRVAANLAAGGVRPRNGAAGLQDSGAGRPVGLGGPRGHGHRQTGPPEENPARHQKSQRHSRWQKTIAWLSASGELRRRKPQEHNTHHTHCLSLSFHPHTSFHLFEKSSRELRKFTCCDFQSGLTLAAKLSAQSAEICKFRHFGITSQSHISIISHLEKPMPPCACAIQLV